MERDSGRPEQTISSALDLTTALPLDAVLGLGVGGMIALRKHERRQAFMGAISDGLGPYAVEVISAELARGPSSELIWKLTVLHSHIGSMLFSIHLDPTADPYSQHTLDLLICQVDQGLNRMLQGLTDESDARRHRERPR